MPNCVAVPNLVEIGQNAAEIWRFFDFPRWQPSAILDLLCVCSDHTRRVFDGLYRCAKFGWNRCSNFDNMHVFRYRVLSRMRRAATAESILIKFGTSIPLADVVIHLKRHRNWSKGWEEVGVRNFAYPIDFTIGF